MGFFDKVFGKTPEKEPLTPEETEKVVNRQKKEIEKNQKTIQSQTETVERLKAEKDKLTAQISILRNEVNEEYFIQSYGFYKPTYSFANSDLYKEYLKVLRDSQKAMIKSNTAVYGTQTWLVNGNAREGQKMVSDIQKLLLTAFNLQCDDIVEHVTIANVQKSIEKIYQLSESISKLGRTMQIQISPQYIELKIQEVRLALDYAQKKQQEKEQIKELREREREEAKVQKEIEEERKKLEKEQKHYEKALEALNDQLLKKPADPNLLAKKAEIEKNIIETKKAIEDVDYRKANIRAGYVYVISNLGSFGENIYKIGMTRRLNPIERIDELSDASVPFNFDVHALIFTEDAPGLEAALHKAFDQKKVNKINPRREFFHVTLDEVKRVVRNNFDKTVEWVDVPPAEQYRQSLKINNDNPNNLR
ncbi:MAG: DUF4041 domain-containing protein [Oscillospiraceae bacterium]|nr:DUF4041 domain-containing protein [Oscillospiraceae bacterium]